ncbi:hypothetical protein ACR77U_13550, partial [Enterococcus faecium]|uniref:hypothetical protein n=1 Tax=Enterococcus faecium TaxID=1352 RepID=UPI003DA36B2A
ILYEVIKEDIEMKVEIELDDLSTDAIQAIIDAMEQDRAEAEKDLSNAESVTKEYMAILRNSKNLTDKEYDDAEHDASEAVEVEKQYRFIYDRIVEPMNDMQRVIAERNGELE